MAQEVLEDLVDHLFVKVQVSLVNLVVLEDLKDRADLGVLVVLVDQEVH